ncbi:MAG: hypothetical protein FWD88_01420, partial [Treponema sp.]|nr:hypothetical protein [Treponema sp.]
ANKKNPCRTATLWQGFFFWGATKPQAIRIYRLFEKCQAIFARNRTLPCPAITDRRLDHIGHPLYK